MSTAPHLVFAQRGGSRTTTSKDSGFMCLYEGRRPLRPPSGSPASCRIAGKTSSSNCCVFTLFNAAFVVPTSRAELAKSTFNTRSAPPTAAATPMPQV